MRQQGFRYYVYVRPGLIDYFRTIEEAVEFQSVAGGTIGEVE